VAVIVSTPLRIATAFLPLLLAGTFAAPVQRSPLSDCLSDVWQSGDGLPHSAVQAVVKTRDGCIWLGTPSGLARVDGVRFTVVNLGQLKVNNVQALLEDRQGRLWI